jgi:hypothetical protein
MFQLLDIAVISLYISKMEPEPSTQVALFRTIKERLPSNLSFVHEVSELLEISYDSAYRRIRGEKELSMDELRKICHTYRISIDSFFNLSRDCILFHSVSLGQSGKTFAQWLQEIYEDMKVIHSAHEKEIMYFAKDIPVFHYFEFPKLFAFKVFFWHKALLPFAMPEGKFNPAVVPEEILTLGRQVLATYNKIPVVEIWNKESFDSVLRQIEYCYVSGYFNSKEEALDMLSVLETMIRHMQDQAEHGFRFFYGEPPSGMEGMYKLYLNEVLLGDNTIHVTTDGKKNVYLTYNVINLLKTSDEGFSKQIGDSLHNLMQKSTQISSSAAKERNRFFNHLAAEIWRLMEEIGK